MKKVVLLVTMFIYILTSCTAVKQNSKEKIQIYIDNAEQYFAQENYDMAKSSFNKALSLVKEEYGEQSKETADICLKIALHSTTYEEAMKYVGIGEEILKGLEDTGGLADVYDAYGLIYERRHEPELACEAYEEALKYCNSSEDDMSKKSLIYIWG